MSRFEDVDPRLCILIIEMRNEAPIPVIRDRVNANFEAIWLRRSICSNNSNEYLIDFHMCFKRPIICVSTVL